MAYTIRKTNGTVLTTVLDGTLDSTYGVNLVGKNYVNFGEPQNDNFVKLLENFASPVSPLTPLPGQLWYNTSAGSISYYDGTGFKTLPNVDVLNSTTVSLSGTIAQQIASLQTQITSNVSAFTANAASQDTDLTDLFARSAAQASTLLSHAAVNASQTASIGGLQANVVSANIRLIGAINSISAINANVGILQTSNVALYAAIANQNNINATFTANAASQQGQISDLYYKAASNANEITNLWANAVSQNSSINLTNASLNNVGTSVTALQAGLIATNYTAGLHDARIGLLEGAGYITAAALTPYATLRAPALQIWTPPGLPSAYPTSPNVAYPDNTNAISTTHYVARAQADTLQTAMDYTDQEISTLESLISGSSGDVSTALSLKAPIASPALTGNPTAPTQVISDNTTKLATTAFVQTRATATLASAQSYTNSQVSSLADTVSVGLYNVAYLNSPAFTNTPTAPTADSATSTTQLATTAFVHAVADAAKLAATTIANVGIAALASTVSTGLGTKAPSASPGFSGIPSAPTAAVGSNTTQLATTAFVQTATQKWGGASKFVSTATPSSSDGVDGDIWLTYQV